MRTWRDGGRWILAAVALLAAGLVVATAPPAGATIASLSRASDTVDPGGSATVTVRVQAAGFTCVSVSAPAGVSADVTPKCSDAQSWSAQLTVSAADDLAPGSYPVRVTDQESGESGGKTFTLRVREPAPAPTTAPPTTATTLPPSTTTTARPTTTTASTTTTALTTTTVAPATTTTSAPLPPGGGFVTVATAITSGVPDEGVFLPLSGAGFRDCLPLSEPCIDPDSALVLVPARSTEVRWEPLAAEERSSPRVDLRGLRPIAPVGVPPADPGAQDYALPVLDLTAPGGQVRTLVRGLDADGKLVTPRAAAKALAAPVADGPMAAPDTATFLASSPFGRPRLLSKDQLSEASPAIALFSSSKLQVLYAVRPDPSWGLNAPLLPLLATESVPYLVRVLDGPPGLFLARPTGLRVPQSGADAGADPVDAADAGGGISPVVLLGLAVAAGAAVTFVAARRRRRRPTSQ